MSLEAYVATEFNEISSGRQQREGAAVAERYRGHGSGVA